MHYYVDEEMKVTNRKLDNAYQLLKSRDLQDV